jgi:hypothetical protein
MKAFKAKQADFDVLYGDWKESYNRLGMVVGAMAATNLGSLTRLYNNKIV